MDHYKPLQAVLEMTKKCNLQCRHCGSACGKKTDKEELTNDEWQNTINQLIDMGTERIIFSGGEPTLKPCLDELITQVVKRGIKYAIITNGYELSDKLLKTLGAFRPYAVGISLDGDEPNHNLIRGKKDSWQKAIDSIKRLKQNAIQVCAVTTVNKWNINSLDLMVDFLADTVDSWQIQLASPFGRMGSATENLISEKNFEFLCRRVIAYRKVYKNLNTQAADCFGMAPPNLIRTGMWEGCSAGIWSIGIDATGNIMPCLSLQNNVFCGNVRKDSLKNIWENSELFSMNRNFSVVNTSNSKCSKCNQFANCRGGCASLSYSYTGEPHQTPLCFYRSFKNETSKGGDLIE